MLRVRFIALTEKRFMASAFMDRRWGCQYDCFVRPLGFSNRGQEEVDRDERSRTQKGTCETTDQASGCSAKASGCQTFH